MFICLSSGHPRCRGLCFFSWTQTKIFYSNQYCQSNDVNQWYSRLWEKIKHTQTKPNETMWLITIHWGLKTRNDRSVQETEQYLYHFYLWSTAMSNCPERVHNRCKNDINTVQFLAQSDRFVSLDLNVSSRATVFNLVLSVYVLFSLKAVSTIDGHYMTDRLQRLSKKIFVCVLLKQQSPLHLGCLWGKQININFSFFGWNILKPIQINWSNDCWKVRFGM